MIEIDFMEWINLALRWTHIFAGIMWVGATYFFTWLDGRFTDLLEAKTNEKDVWMVHSGGFYRVEKQKVPAVMPKTLHWFKWEAAITWLSGILLLLYLYYYGGLMVDETMNESVAMLAGFGAILISWPIYDLLWKSPLAENEVAATTVSYVLIVAVAYALNMFMSPRAAYLHVGAVLGTLMTANVWEIIIPAQRRMVQALKEGTPVNVALGERAKKRSKHNTFMAMVVVFTMLSNHFPTITYGADMNWLVLAVMTLVGFGVAKIVRRA
jgi:uncharacterized membrane protein